MKTLTILTFDFDYDFGTPFVFIKMFLNTHYDEMKFVDPKLFSTFDKKICETTLTKIYKSGSDICCFWPPEIIAAGMIFQANQEMSPQNFLGEEGFWWLKNVTQRYN